MIFIRGMVLKRQNEIGLRFHAFTTHPMRHRRDKHQIPLERVSMVMQARYANATLYRPKAKKGIKRKRG